MVKMKGFRKLLAMVICAVMVMGIVPGLVPEAKADGGSITLGAEVLTAGKKVWFGETDWRVLENVGNGKALLISNDQLAKIIFNPDQNAVKANVWAGSRAQAWCTDYYNKWASGIEKNAILATSKEETNDYQNLGQNNQNTYGPASLINEYLFFLSVEEANTLFTNNDDRKLSGRNPCWWLRSPYKDSTGNVGLVNSNGSTACINVDSEISARPAFNLNLNAVLFTSETSSDYELTLVDPSLTITPGTMKRENNLLTIPVTVSSGCNYASLLITNKKDSWDDNSGWNSGATMQYYQTAAVSGTTSTVTFTLPSNYEANRENWKVWLLAEQVNPGTGYASKLKEIAVPYQLKYDANGGTGTMDSVTVFENDTFSFPECKFGAPEGMAFDHWEMSGVDSSTLNGIFKPGSTVTIAKNCASEGVITVKACWKDAATIKTAPKAINPTYSGIAQKLVTNGEAKNGTMNYAIGDSDTTAPTSGWDTNVPEGTLAGTYYVWYKAEGTGEYLDSEAKCCPAEIGKTTLTVTAKEKTITYGDAPANDGAGYSGFVNGETEETAGLTGTLVYTYNYKQNDPVGSYTITPDGLSAANYEMKYVPGTLTVAPKSITGATVTLDKTQLSWNGSEQSVQVTGVIIDGLALKENEYTVTGNKGTDLGDYTVTVTGKGNFIDSATKAWKIVEKAMTVSAPNVNADYDGQPHGITVTVTDPASGAEIKYGTTEGTYDRDASPTLTEVGTLIVYYKVTAANYTDYTGSAVVTVSKGGPAVAATVTTNNRTYDGTEKPLVTVSGEPVGGTMQYALGTDAATAPTEGWGTSIPTAAKTGTYYVWYKAIGDENHSDSAAACVTVKIEEAKPTKRVSIAKAKVSVKSPVYTGDKLTPDLKVTLKGKTLKLNDDYTVVKWKNNRKIGTATVTLKGVGKYKGKVKATFKIIPAGVEKVTVTRGSKELTVKWTREETEEFDGYQVEYSRHKDFSDRTLITITDKSVKKVTITDLEPHKKYYIRVRTFTNGRDGLRYKSRWSELIKKKQKK